MLSTNGVLLEAGQSAEPEIDDGLRLDLGHAELGLQVLARLLRILRVADQLNDRVEIRERNQVAIEDVTAALGAIELELGAADDDVALMRDVVPEHVVHTKGARDALDERDHVGAERRLQLRVLVELVEDDRGDRVLLELDDDAHTLVGRVVLDVGDLGNDLLDGELGNLGDDAVVAALLDGERQLRDDDGALAVGQVLDVGARAQADLAAARGVGRADTRVAHDHTTGREVGARHDAHQLVERDLRITDHRDRGVDGLAQVMRRDVRGHADSDAGRAVDEQVREARRQHQRLLARAVVVGAEVDGVGVDVAEHQGRDARQTALRVAHGGSREAVDVAEVALPVDEDGARRERLRHADEGVVDRLVAVRMVRAHRLADDLRALDVRSVRLEAELVHRVQHAAMHRLEAVAHIGQCAPDDHAHRVIEIRRAHLVGEFAWLGAAVRLVYGCFRLRHRSPVRRGRATR